MKKEFALKKIIPTLLIAVILFTGFFGVFGVRVVRADNHTVKNFPAPSKFDPNKLTDIEMREFLKEGLDKEKDKDKIKEIDSLSGSKLFGVFGGKFSDTLKKEGFSPQEIAEFIAKKKPLPTLNERNEQIKNAKCMEGLFGGFTINISVCIKQTLANVGEAVLEFFGFILGVSGKLLNVVVEKTVLQMGVGVKNIGALEEGWKVFRDLSNILIIFALLMIGIATILRSEQYGAKKLLALLIAVALLINFSLFFTQVVIDSSNLIALKFYDRTKIVEEARWSWVAGWHGYGDSYMQAFKLSTLYDVGDFSGDFSDIVQDNRLGATNIFLITIFGSILFIVATFTILAGAFLLVSRYVFLIFLMILSPIAFIAYVLPATSGYAKQWMSMLFKYAFFAPVYFLLNWFVIKVINSPAFGNSIGLVASSKDGAVSFATITDINSFDGSIALVLNFIIIIFFLIASLLLASQMGIKGSETVMKWGASARKWGQGVVGRGAMYAPRRAGRFAKLKAGAAAEGFQESKGGVARFLRKIPGVVGGAGALGAAGRATVKAREELHKDSSKATLWNKLNSKLTSEADKRAIAKNLFAQEQGEPKKQARIFDKNMSADQKKEAFENQSANNRATMLEHIAFADHDRLLKNLSKEEQEKTRDAMSDIKVKGININIHTAQNSTGVNRANAVDSITDAFNLRAGRNITEDMGKLYKKMSERSRLDLEKELKGAMTRPDFDIIQTQLRTALSNEDKDRTKKMEYEVFDKTVIETLKNSLQTAINSGSQAQVQAVLDGMESRHIKEMDPVKMSHHLAVQGMTGDILNEIHKSGKYTKAQKAIIKAANSTNPFFTNTEAGKLW